jgi:hypothetical protein
LGRHERIEQVSPIETLQRDDFPARAATVRLQIKRLPKMVDRCRSGIRTDIQQHADADYGKGGISEISQRNSIRNCRGYSLRLEDRTKGIEEPTMTVVYGSFEYSDPV